MPGNWDYKHHDLADQCFTLTSIRLLKMTLLVMPVRMTRNHSHSFIHQDLQNSGSCNLKNLSFLTVLSTTINSLWKKRISQLSDKHKDLWAIMSLLPLERSQPLLPHEIILKRELFYVCFFNYLPLRILSKSESWIQIKIF